MKMATEKGDQIQWQISAPQKPFNNCASQSMWTYGATLSICTERIQYQ